jgi:hypothetical protein
MTGIFANFGKRLSIAFSGEKNMTPAGILKVEGTKIVDTDGKEVLLRGVCSSIAIELVFRGLLTVVMMCAGWCRRMGKYGELHHRIPRTRIPDPTSSCRGSWEGESSVLLR